MPVRLPESRWPAELLEDGPDEDPSILLSRAVEIGNVLHRLLAVRVKISVPIWGKPSTPTIRLS